MLVLLKMLIIYFGYFLYVWHKTNHKKMKLMLKLQEEKNLCHAFYKEHFLMALNTCGFCLLFVLLRIFFGVFSLRFTLHQYLWVINQFWFISFFNKYYNRENKVFFWIFPLWENLFISCWVLICAKNYFDNDKITFRVW